MTDELNITKDNGEIVTAAYVRRRVISALSRWRHIYTIDERRAAIKATLDNPQWLKSKRGQTVGSIIREIENKI